MATSNTNTALGAVVVGTGFGVLTHVRALRGAGFDVVALVGRDPDKTAERARRFDVPHASTSLAEALAFDGVAAVTIATPPHTHAEIVRAAIAAGKHVLCEKPFARNANEARELLAAAEAAGIVHLLGTELRYEPGAALLARVVRSGAIGTPRLATILLHIPMLADATGDGAVPDWWGDPAQGGGWLGAHAPHVIDQLRTMLGEFAGVSASLPHVGAHPWAAEDAYLAHFRTRSGAVGMMEAVASDRGPMLFVTRVVGTHGTAWAEGPTVRVADAQGTREVALPTDLVVGAPEPPPGDLLVSAYDRLHAFGLEIGPYTKLAAIWRDLIEGRASDHDPAPATFADGVASMLVLDAIRSSANQGGTWITVDA